MSLQEIAKEIRDKFQNQPMNRPFVVGIDGLGGAGKTTLVNQLLSELQQTNQVVVIHMDDHIVERNKRNHTGQAEWYEYYYLQWDIRMLTEQLFKKLDGNNWNLNLPFYEKSMDELTMRNILLTANTIVLIEGVFIQRKEWKPYYDFTIFLHCPREIRYERVLKRDTYLGSEQMILEKYNNRYWLAEDYYMETENPVQLADRVLNIS